MREDLSIPSRALIVALAVLVAWVCKIDLIPGFDEVGYYNGSFGYYSHQKSGHNPDTTRSKSRGNQGRKVEGERDREREGRREGGRGKGQEEEKREREEEGRRERVREMEEEICSEKLNPDDFDQCRSKLIPDGMKGGTQINVTDEVSSIPDSSDTSKALVLSNIAVFNFVDVHRPRTAGGRVIEEVDEGRVRELLESLLVILHADENKFEKWNESAPSPPILASQVDDLAISSEFVIDGLNHLQDSLVNLSSEKSNDRPFNGNGTAYDQLCEKLMETKIFTKEEILNFDQKKVYDILLAMARTIDWNKFWLNIFIAFLYLTCKGTIQNTGLFLFFFFCEVVLPSVHPAEKTRMITRGLIDSVSGFFWLRRTVIYLTTIAHLGILQFIDSNEMRIIVMYYNSRRKTWFPTLRLRMVLSVVIFIYTLYNIYQLWEAAEKGEKESLFKQKLEIGDARLIAALCNGYSHIMLVELLTPILLVLYSSVKPHDALDYMPYTYFFWFLILYYQPMDDMWLPMCLQIARYGIKIFFWLVDWSDFFLEPMTFLLELIYIILSCLYSYEFPYLLCLRFLFYFSAAVTLFHNLRVYLSEVITMVTHPRQKVIVYTPVDPIKRSTRSEPAGDNPYPMANAIPGSELFAGSSYKIPGHWIKSVAWVRMDPKEIHLGNNPKGTQKIVRKLFDDRLSLGLSLHSNSSNARQTDTSMAPTSCGQRDCVYKEMVYSEVCRNRFNLQDEIVLCFKEVYWQYRAAKTAQCFTRKLSEISTEEGREGDSDSPLHPTLSSARPDSSTPSVSVEFLPCRVIQTTTDMQLDNNYNNDVKKGSIFDFFNGRSDRDAIHRDGSIAEGKPVGSSSDRTSIAADSSNNKCSNNNTNSNNTERESPEGSRFYTVEPYMSGEYKKWTGNFFENSWNSDLRNNEVLAAFIHWNYAHSMDLDECQHLCNHSDNYMRMICDIQGTKVKANPFLGHGTIFRLTDPQCHSSIGCGNYGLGDLGYEGTKGFLANHHCNRICDSLKVDAQDGSTDADGSVKKVFLSSTNSMKRELSDHEKKSVKFAETNLFQIAKNRRIYYVFCSVCYLYFLVAYMMI